METCELCRSVLNSNGRRLQCPGCKKFLCESCGELKSKLLLMTNGYNDSCGCTLLREIVAPEVEDSEDQRHYPDKQTYSVSHGNQAEPVNITRQEIPPESMFSQENGGHVNASKQSTPNIVQTDQTESAKNNYEPNEHNEKEKTTNFSKQADIRGNNAITDKRADEGIDAQEDGNPIFKNQLQYDVLPPVGIQKGDDVQSHVSNIPINRVSTGEVYDSRPRQQEISESDKFLKEVPTDALQNVPTDALKEDPTNDLKDIPKEMPIDALKEIPTDALKEDPTNTVKDIPKAEPTNVLKDIPKEVPADTLKEVPADALKEVPVDALKEVPTDALEEVPSDAIKRSVSQSSDDTSLSLKMAVPQVKKDKPSSPSRKSKRKLAKHTCAGCGRRDCEGQFMKMMKAMTLAAKDKNYSIHNVVPDGNCMFAAVVDQLEINGDNSYSPKSLRLACVEHLKSNPEADDGTHYEMFMDGESWTDYLNRMTQEGQWGDHLMLQAISQVTGRNIEILQGGGKQEITKITTALAKDNQRALHLGHVGEFHYVSLWETSKEDLDQLSSDDEDVLSSLNSLSSLNNSIVFQEARKRDMFFREDYIDPYSDIPSLHLSFLLKKLLPVNVALNEADRCMHTVLTLEYQEDSMAADDLKATGQNTQEEAKIARKVIGDVPNGLYMKNIYWRETTRNEAGESNCDYKDVSVLFIYNYIPTFRKKTYEPGECPVVIKTDGTHPGYASLMTYYPRQWSADSKAGPAYIPNHHVVFTPPEMQCRKDTKDVKKSPIYQTFSGKTTPALHCKWPDEATEWITRTRPSNWPSAPIISSIKADGCHLVSGSHPKSLNPDDEFKFCFGMAERTLCNEALSRDQRYCLMVFSALCSQELKGSTLITIDHIQRVFFYACEDLPDECWNSNLGSCIFYLLDSLNAQVERKNIPCYFISQNNTIDHLSEIQIKEVVEKLSRFRLFPLQNVLSLTKDCDLGSDIFNVIIQDMEQFKVTRSVRESVLNCFVPHAIKSARGDILRRHFKTAMDTLQTAYEERLTVATCDDQVPFQSFFNEAVQGIPLDSQWWFLLYSDEKLGMTMSSDMSLNLQPVTLGELVDPVIARDYANHLIPQAMAYNRCQLLTNFAWFLLSKYRTQQATEYLVLCITTYRERLDYEENPQCPPETIEKYQDFNERTMYKVLVYLYYALYRLKQEHTFTYYFEIVCIVCEKLNVREAYSQAYTIATYMDANWAQYWDGMYRGCKNSDPSLVNELFLDTINNPDL